MSGHVLPAFPENHFRHRSTGNSGLPRKVRLPLSGRHARAKLSDLFLRQLGASVVFASNQHLRMAGEKQTVASCDVSPPLSNHVIEVTLRCAEEEVRGPDAWAVVAAVADHESLRDRTLSEPPANTVRALVLSGCDADCTITQREPAARPNPTRPEMRHMLRHGAVLVHFRPKPFFDTLSHSSVEPPCPRFRGQGRSGVTSTLAVRLFYHHSAENLSKSTKKAA